MKKMMTRPENEIVESPISTATFPSSHVNIPVNTMLDANSINPRKKIP
jgi:hypothetical protein